MIDALPEMPVDAKDFRAPQSRLRKLGTYVPVGEIGPDGSVNRTLRFVPHEQSLTRLAPELRIGSGTGQAGPGIGEPRPIRPQSFVEPTPIFVSPGEVRI